MILKLYLRVNNLDKILPFFIEGLPANNRPLGNFPSGDIFLIFKSISLSSLKVVYILLKVYKDREKRVNMK